MTSEPGSTSSAEGHELPPRDADTRPQQTYRLPVPPDQKAAAKWAHHRSYGRPQTVTIASVLWICLGVLLALAAIGYLVGPRHARLSTDPIAPLIVLGIGVIFVVLASRMRRGENGSRIALTVLGAILLFGIWTALFVIPAIVLQFRSDSNAWFHALNARRAS